VLADWHWVPDALSTAGFLGLVVASVVTSALTAAFGIGGGIAMLAALLLLLPPTVVVPLHGVIQGGSNLGRALTMRAAIRRPILGWFSAGAIVGTLLGSLVVVALPTRTLQLVLAIFILWTLWGPGMRKRAIPDRGFALVGLVASFCTMFLGATGPMVGAFWRVEKLGREGVVSNHAACMTVQHGLKVGAFVALGFAFADWIPFLLAMVAAGFVGTVLGNRVLRRLPDAGFDRVFKLILTVLALRLLWEALLGED
jgi:uncharacterized membrane protein YfcA